MRKFKYVKYNVWVDYLTLGKVYDLILYIKSAEGYIDQIRIENDNGVIREYILYTPGGNEAIFEEVTTEYRNNVIDGILE